MWERWRHYRERGCRIDEDVGVLKSLLRRLVAISCQEVLCQSLNDAYDLLHVLRAAQLHSKLSEAEFNLITEVGLSQVLYRFLSGPS